MMAAASDEGTPKMLMVTWRGARAAHSGWRTAARTVAGGTAARPDHVSARQDAVPGGEPGPAAIGPRFQPHARGYGQDEHAATVPPISQMCGATHATSWSAT